MNQPFQKNHQRFNPPQKKSRLLLWGRPLNNYYEAAGLINRLLCAEMKCASLLLSFMFCQVSYATTFGEAEALASKYAADLKTESKELKEAKRVAVNNLWRSTAPCFNDEGPERVQVILEISSSGKISNVWSDSGSERAVCIKQKAFGASFPAPVKAPDYVKITM